MGPTAISAKDLTFHFWTQCMSSRFCDNIKKFHDKDENDVFLGNLSALCDNNLARYTWKLGRELLMHNGNSATHPSELIYLAIRIASVSFLHKRRFELLSANAPVWPLRHQWLPWQFEHVHWFNWATKNTTGQHINNDDNNCIPTQIWPLVAKDAGLVAML